MKQIQVIDKFHRTPYTMFHLASEEELEEYIEYESPRLTKSIQGILRSRVPDHYSDYASGFVYHNLYSFNNKNIVEGAAKVDAALYEKYDRMRSSIKEGIPVLVNREGGYCFFREDYHELVSDLEDANMDCEFHQICNRAEIINLENDPSTERYTLDHFRELRKDKYSTDDLSTICHLRMYEDKQLLSLLKKFVRNGGDTLFQYTTAMDVDQMFHYTRLCLKAGIKRYIFHLEASETTCRADHFFDWLKKKKVTLEVKYLQ